MRKLLLLVTVLVVFSAQSFATTYYSQGNLNANTLASWNSSRTGGGSTPANFTTAGDVFIIQGTGGNLGAPHTMTTSAAVTFGSATNNTKLEVESGATLTVSVLANAVTVAAAGQFQLDAGATYNHNHSGAFSAILGGVENFDPTSNFNVGASNPTTGPTSASLTGSFGNFTFSGTNATMQCNDVFPNVAGNFTHNGSVEFRMSAGVVANGGFTVNGNFTMSGSGIFNFGNGLYGVAGTPLAPSVTIKGNFIFTSGTILSSITNGSAGAGNSNAKFIFAKTGTQTFTKAAGVGTITATVSGFRQISFNVQSGSTLDMGTSVLDGAATTNIVIVVNSGAGLITANTNGIASGLTASGSFQNLGGSRTFSTGADYTYNAASAQITGTGFTGATTLNIGNASGVTLTSPATVTTLAFTINNAKLDLGTSNLTLGTVSVPNASNYIVTSSTGSVIKSILGAGSFTFPIGRNASTYNPVTITNNGSTATYTVSVGSSTYPQAANGTNAQWSISTPSATSSTLAFGWTTSDAGATLAATPANGTGWNYVNNGVWTNMNGTTAIGSPNTTTVTGSSVDPASPIWTVAMATVAVAPTVTTTAVTSVTSSTASTGGNVTSEGTSPVTERGVVYSTTANPTTANTKVSDGVNGGLGAYTSSLSGLAPGTTYHVRAYAISADGTSYGSDQSFTTSTTAPVVSTGTAGTPTANAVTISTNNVSSDGGALITQRGVAYNTIGTPTTADLTVTSAGTTGNFNSSLSNLTASTTYFVRAYAINSVGTSYGNEISFTTSAPTVPTVSTTAVTSITTTTANTGGNVTSNGGTPITERGVVYSTSANPTTADLKVTDPAVTTGSFVSALSGLSAATTYHVRAYSINSAGTAYGSDVSFTTSLPPTTYYSQTSGDVTVTTNWNTSPTGGGTSPTDFTNAGDVFIIQNGNSMTTSGAWTVSGSGSKVEIANGGTLTSTALISVPNFQVDNGGTYNHNYTSATANGLTTDFPGSTGTGRVFGATSNVTINNWATTASSAPVALPTIAAPGWGNLTINIPTLAGSIQMAGALTAVQGDLTILSTGGTTREFRLSATTAYTLAVGGNLTVTGGILNLGSSSSSSVIIWNVGGNLVFNGGTVATASSNTNVTFNITGALNFSSGTNGSTSSLTYNIGNGMNVSGGTFNLGTSSSHVTTLNVTGDINLTNAGQMSNTSSSNNIVSATGNFNMSGTSLYQMQNSSASGHILSLTIGGNFNMTSGTFTGGSGSQKATVTFSGATTPSVSFTAGGTITAAKPTDWIIAANKTVTLNSNLPVFTNTLVGTVTVNGTLDAGTNAVTGTGAFTLSSGGTLKMGSPLGISSVAASGNIQVTGARNYSQSGNYEYNGSSAQVTGNQLPATVNDLTINNASGVTLTNSVTTNGKLALTNGILTTGANTVTVAATGSITGGSASSYVNGTLKRFIASGASSASFPIGDATAYTPADLALNGTITASTGSITATTTATDHPQIASSGLNSNLTVNRYWTLTNNTPIPGLTSYSPTLTFVAGDKDPGVSFANFVVRVYNGSTWSTTGNGTHTLLSTQATGVTAFGDLQIGEANSLTVSTQPSSSAVCQGSGTSFTAASTSTPTTTIQWQRSTDGTAAYVDITSSNMDAGTTYSGFTTGTLSLTTPQAALDNYHYRAVFTNINGSVNSNPATLNVTVQPSATINYPNSPYCANGGTALVNRTGTAGGVYSSTPGLTIDASTGAITLGTSTAGTYNVNYFIAAGGGCTFATANASVTIVNPASLSISYANNPFCQTGNGSVTRTGTAGGTYSGDAGMSIDAASGLIFPAASTPGVHTITYSVNFPAGCTSSATTQVTILPTPTMTLGTATPVCFSASAQTASLTYTASTNSPTTYTLRANPSGPMPGFVPVTNAALSPNTITVNIPAGTAGGVYYFDLFVRTAAGCSSGKYTFSVTVMSQATTTITYNGSPFCRSGSSYGLVTRTGGSGGTYSAAPAGLSIDASTGTIFPGSSVPGNFTVTYTVATAGCTFTTTTPVTVLATPTINLGTVPAICFSPGAQTANLPYTATSGSPVTYSIAVGTNNPMPGFTPVVNAALPASPIAINIPAGTTGGTYYFNVTVRNAQGCVSGNYVVGVTVVSNNTTIAYNGGLSICQTGSSIVTRTGAGGGTYSSTGGLVIDATSGTIFPAASTPGTYTVTYTINTGSCTFTTTTNVTIEALPKVSLGTIAPVCQSANPTSASVPYTLLSGNPTTYSIVTGVNPMPGFTPVTNAALPASPITVNIPAGTTPGTYYFYLTLKSAAGCTSARYAFGIKVNPLPTASISYANSPYSTATGGATVTFSGTTGGTFSSTPGLNVNATTGSIYPATSTPGTYTVTYSVTTAASCTVTTTTSVTIFQAPTPKIVSTGTKGNATTSKATPIVSLSDNIVIAPNPVEHMLNINAAGVDGTMQLRITNAAGRVVVKNTRFTSSFKLDMSGYAAGLYVVEMVNEKTGEITRKKIVKL